jgi:hypothetical protein
MRQVFAPWMPRRSVPVEKVPQRPHWRRWATAFEPSLDRSWMVGPETAFGEMRRRTRSRLLASVALMPLPYGLENRLEEPAVFV